MAAFGLRARILIHLRNPWFGRTGELRSRQRVHGCHDAQVASLT